MDIKDLNPYVRFCSSVNLSSPYPRLLKAYDFRLFYVLEGGFTACFEDKSIEVGKGGLVVFPPATAYRLIPNKCGKSNHIIVNYDLVCKNYGTPTKKLEETDGFRMEEVYSTECFAPFDKILYIEKGFFCADMLLEMCKEMKEERRGYLEMLSGQFKTLLIKIMRESEKNSSDRGDALCEKIKEYILAEYDREITNEDIARNFGYHPYYINALFKRKTGQTMRSFIIDRRVDRAKELLLTSSHSVAVIGSECGFSSPSYFSEVFLKRTGISPGEYRRKVK